MRRLHNEAMNLDILQQQKNGSHTSAVYCEQEIIDLHNMFLTNGIHTINVVDLGRGRELVQTLLQSLHYYTSVACLTLNHEQLPHDICDMYAEMATEYGPIITNEIVEQYLLDRFYFDFIWIEASPQLVQSSWYGEFQDRLSSMNIQTMVPTIILTADEGK